MGCHRFQAPAHCVRYQASSGGQRRMRQRALQIGPYARHVTKILRLAVAAVEPGEDAEDLGGALRRRAWHRACAKAGASKPGSAAAARGCSAPTARSPASPARRRARPAAARRGRRPPAPSPRPGNRAGRCAPRPRVPAARTDWANENRAAPRSAARRAPAEARRARACDIGVARGARRARRRAAADTSRAAARPRSGTRRGRSAAACSRRPARPAARRAALACSAASTSAAAS